LFDVFGVLYCLCASLIAFSIMLLPEVHYFQWSLEAEI
jgi:hypothetical protein